GLCPERDFKVECGGFAEHPVYSLKYVPDTRYDHKVLPRLAGNQVWQVSVEDSDVIKSVRTIATENGSGQSWAKIATISARDPWVLHGSRLDRVQITEVKSRKKVYTAASRGSEELSNLGFLDCNTLLLCCITGQLFLTDIQQLQSLVEPM
ncbi:WDR73 protein, partial [Spelaeornis formosus]|nr:WDR73 protein [Elachura formosa]